MKCYHNTSCLQDINILIRDETGQRRRKEEEEDI